jgi:hypothetical protein
MSIVLNQHYAGFFSTTTLILFQLINHKKNNRINPTIIESSQVFSWYRYTSNNIFFDFFKIKNVDSLENISLIDFDYELRGELQFKKYSDYNFDVYFKYVDVYFNLSDNVMNIYNNIINKYNIELENTCCLFLRGNDKARECQIPDYNKYILKGKELLQSNPNLKFLIQSDEQEFISEMCINFPNNIVFVDEIRVIPRDIKRTVDNNGMTPQINHKYALNFLAIVYIMSKCKYVVCNPGNISVWILLYRKHIKDFYQLY